MPKPWKILEVQDRVYELHINREHVSRRIQYSMNFALYSIVQAYRGQNSVREWVGSNKLD